jgi:Na+-transporting methylmalonyl-CoA/oxaloacetate decarboxylase gamma subunit
MTVGEDLVLGLQTLVLGMIVTFAGLLILQGVMILMARFSKANGNNGGPSTSSVLSDPTPNKNTSPVKAEKPAAQVERIGLPDEEKAAISAVMAVLTAESGAPMQIRSVRPMGSVPAATPNTWGLAGRQDIMAARRRA